MTFYCVVPYYSDTDFNNNVTGNCKVLEATKTPAFSCSIADVDVVAMVLAEDDDDKDSQR